MKLKLTFLILFVIPLIIALPNQADNRIDFSYNTVDYSEINVNNSEYWDGHEFIIGSIATIETDPWFESWYDSGTGVCTDGAGKCGFFSTCSQITDPIDAGCGAITGDWANVTYLKLDQTNWFNDSTGWVYWTGNNQLGFNETKFNLTEFNLDTFFSINKTWLQNHLTNLSYNNILSVDVLNHILYDLGGLLSLDFNDRKLYASDGSDVILDWYTPGLADFDDTSITTTTNITTSKFSLTSIGSNSCQPYLISSGDMCNNDTSIFVKVT